MSSSATTLASAPNRVASILAIMTLIWCLVAKVELIETLFRIGVVYLAISVIGMFLARQYVIFTEEGRRQAIESERRAVLAASMQAELSEETTE